MIATATLPPGSLQRMVGLDLTDHPMVSLRPYFPRSLLDWRYARSLRTFTRYVGSTLSWRAMAASRILSKWALWFVIKASIFLESSTLSWLRLSDIESPWNPAPRSEERRV